MRILVNEKWLFLIKRKCCCQILGHFREINIVSRPFNKFPTTAYKSPRKHLKSNKVSCFNGKHEKSNKNHIPIMIETFGFIHFGLSMQMCRKRGAALMILVACTATTTTTTTSITKNGQFVSFFSGRSVSTHQSFLKQKYLYNFFKLSLF